MLQDREVRADVQVGKTCHRTGEDEGQRSTSIRPSASCIVEKDLGNWAQLQLNAFTPACRSRKLLLTCLKSQWVQMTIDLKFPPEIWKRSLGLTGYSIVVFFKIWCEMMTAWIKKKNEVFLKRWWNLFWGEGDRTESGFCDPQKSRFTTAHFSLLESWVRIFPPMKNSYTKLSDGRIFC